MVWIMVGVRRFFREEPVTVNNHTSVLCRGAFLDDLASQSLDVLIVGGGITGAGIALDASVRGLRVGLVEKSDFGSGTSSRSTKLIHGGLRYLKQGEIKLVQEVGRERAILFQNAPHLVVPAPMLLPIYKGGTYGYWASSIGLYVYDWLAGVDRKERRKMLGREQTKKQEPLLKADGLRGAGYYFEYRTDDARLTLDVLKTAIRYGARAVNYAEVTEFLYQSGKVIGVKVRDQLTGRTVKMQAQKVVNAAGPWVDVVRDMDQSPKRKRLFHTKGVHLVVEYQRLPVRQSVYFDTPDGRMVFVIPRGQMTYIGTTDTVYTHSIDHPRTTKKDCQYLILAVNAMFPEVQLTEKDVLSHWAGLRPLIYEEGKGPFELSRQDELFVSKTGLITIAGGKLTGYRKMAEKVVDQVIRDIFPFDKKVVPSCTTDKVTISGGEQMGYATYESWQRELMNKGLSIGIEEETVLEWIKTYGTNILKIYERYSQIPQGKSCRALRAQLRYSIEEEMTVHAVDFLRLRTGWMYFDIGKALLQQANVLQIMGEVLRWDREEILRQQKMVSELFQQIYELPPSDNSEPIR